MIKSKILGLINTITNFLKGKLLSLPKNVIKMIIGAVVTVSLITVFFIFRDGLYLFRLTKDKITE